YIMTCCLPRDVQEGWLARFAEGLAADQREFGIALMGGDTTATPGPLTLSVTALGTVAAGKELRRPPAPGGGLATARASAADAARGRGPSRPPGVGWGMRRWGLGCSGDACREMRALQRSSPATISPSRAWPSASASRGSPQPAWMSPTVSPATLAISPRPRA